MTTGLRHRIRRMKRHGRRKAKRPQLKWSWNTRREPLISYHRRAGGQACQVARRPNVVGLADIVETLYVPSKLLLENRLLTTTRIASTQRRARKRGRLPQLICTNGRDRRDPCKSGTEPSPTRLTTSSEAVMVAICMTRVVSLLRVEVLFIFGTPHCTQ